MSTAGQTVWRARAAGLALALAAVLAAAGCQNRSLAGGLRSAGVGGAPDEFMVLPTRPLEMPTNLTALPTPTPGAANLVDYNPKADAVASLTGKPALRTASGEALVARTGAGSPGVRSVLASEDAQFRAEHRGLLLERMFARDKEALVYEDMALSQGPAFKGMRAAGVGVPPAPPPLLGEAN